MAVWMTAKEQLCLVTSIGLMKDPSDLAAQCYHVRISSRKGGSLEALGEKVSE